MRKPLGRKGGGGRRGPDGGGNGALGGGKFTTKSGGEERDGGGKFNSNGRGGGEDRQVVNIRPKGPNRGEAEEGTDKEVENKEEEIGGDGAALADSSDNCKRRGGRAGKGKVGGRGKENVRDIMEEVWGGVDPLEGGKNGGPIEEVVSLPEVCLEEEEALAAGGGREEGIADGEEVGEGGAAWEKGVLGRVDEGGNEGDKERGEVFTNDPVEGVCDSDGAKLVGKGGREDFGDEGDVGGREGGRKAIRESGSREEGGPEGFGVRKKRFPSGVRDTIRAGRRTAKTGNDGLKKG